VLLVSAQGYHARTGSPSYWGGALESFIAAQPAAQAFVSALFFLPFVALVALTAEALIHGRRLVRTLGPGLPDPQHAARALHTPSWKRSFWDKPPFDSLLLPEERASSRTPSGRTTTPTAGSEAETVTHTPEGPRAREG
jgi:hypothetical protein